MKLLLDSSVLVDLLRGRNHRRALLAELVSIGSSLCISTISIAELYAGMRVHEEPATAGILANFTALPILATTARRAGDLKATWARTGRTLSITDMLIVATALEHDLILMTDNRRDFPMPELRLFDLP